MMCAARAVRVRVLGAHGHASDCSPHACGRCAVRCDARIDSSRSSPHLGYRKGKRPAVSARRPRGGEHHHRLVDKLAAHSERSERCAEAACPCVMCGCSADFQQARPQRVDRGEPCTPPQTRFGERISYPSCHEWLGLVHRRSGAVSMGGTAHSLSADVSTHQTRSTASGPRGSTAVLRCVRFRLKLGAHAAFQILPDVASSPSCVLVSRQHQRL